MGQRIHSLLHWDEIHKNSRKLERKANRLLAGIGYKEKGNGKLKRIKIKKPKKQWIQPKYNKYIKSRSWYLRRMAFFAKYGELCSACGAGEHIDVHHISYRHLGRELDEELVQLCRDCHKEYHEKHGVKQDNIKTHDFIKGIQMGITLKQKENRDIRLGNGPIKLRSSKDKNHKRTTATQLNRS